MIGFRGKALMGLILYFAGFASAVYFITPSASEAGTVKYKISQAVGNFDSEKSKEALTSIRTKVTEFVHFAEDKASKVGTLIEAKRAADEK